MKCLMKIAIYEMRCSDFFYARENLVMISKKIEVKSFKNFLKKSKKCFF
jgi:hypothetical protein